MKPVDDLMATCPLKHEIRVSLWEYFIKKLKKRPVRYLTLYSPPLMDVKFLTDKGLIETKNGVYSGVVGVGINANAEADTTSSLPNRLEHLLSGNINDLLSGNATQAKKVRQLEEQFPFDVINLDYTDTLHRYGFKGEISPHIDAIQTILQRQSKKGQGNFVLFLTTRVDDQSYPPAFIEHLQSVLDSNIQNTPGFREKIEEEMEVAEAKQLSTKNFNNFFALSLVKHLLEYLKHYNYDLEDGRVMWLVRDDKPPVRFLLHIALHIKLYEPPRATQRNQVGKRHNNVEHKSVKFISKSQVTLKETLDKARLQKQYGEVIRGYNESTFEIKIPQIKK